MKGAIALAAASAALAVGMKLEARASASSSAAASGTSGTLPTVTVQGNAFFAGGSRFYIRGVDYQPGGSSNAADPIADVNACQRDVKEFQKLGINTIRVYTVDNTANHDQCMAALANAGIYLALDVNTPKYSLNRADPATSYNPTYLQNVFATIDAFAGYSNTLLFFSGNEVINDDNTTNTAPYVKAVTRDMKQYLGDRGYRKVPVGYSAADVSSNRYDMATYMNCGSDDQRSDFFAFNDYSWCDPSSFQQSGWDKKVQQYSNYSIPLFLSEFGCITNKRQFQEISALYGSQMTSVYSGGLVYEYSEEGNGYGLVNLNGGSVTEKPDFTALQSALASAKPSGDGGYKSSGSPAACPSQDSTWQVSQFSGTALPAMPSGATQYLKNGAGKGQGLPGSGSQNSPGGSSATATAAAAITQYATQSGVAAAAAASGSHSSAAHALLAGEIGSGPFVCAGLVSVFMLLGMSLM